MAELLTDDEKLEAIKKWWKDNGLAVISGIAIGLGAVFGWRAWVDYQTRTARQASLQFEQLLMTANADAEPAAVEPGAQRLLDDFGGTPYAALGQLALAKARIGAGDTAGAAAALRVALETAPDPALGSLAALRLARVLLDRGDTAAARDLIAAHGGTEGYRADFAALRGDLAVAEDRPDEARAAYREALDAGAGGAALIELKLKNLPASDTGRESS